MSNKIHKEIKLKLDKPISIVGMMGCGKSYIGSKLADLIGMDFFDSDALIEEEQGRLITEIFSKYGEDYFRNLEVKKINELLGQGSCVISTGGGALINAETLSNIKDMSISIWLKADIDSIMQRLLGDMSRPLLQCDNPKEVLENILIGREDLYAQADIHIDNSSSDSDNSVINNILQELTKYNENS